MDRTPQLNAALAKAKAEFPTILANKNVKIPTKTGREINFTYAELEEIAQAVVPTLSANGLAIAHQMQFVEDKFCLVSTLRHESGEQIESLYPLPIGFSDAKELGIQISYSRRYNTLCLLDITVIDSQNWEETKRKLAREIQQEAGLTHKPKDGKQGSILHDLAGVNPAQTISEAQAKRLWAIARKECNLSDGEVRVILTEFKVESTADIPASQYDKVIERIKNFNPKF
ncbi:hypothetical protein A6S26_05525 [Nostoc sp. ATCC 43529]|nr:hypothetical protein A6S26_05525 [Nostoc sp. ATCC 43529]